MANELTPAEIRCGLCSFFLPEDVDWKPQTVKGNRALAIAYIDARAVMDRLDEVVGIDGWRDDYLLFPDGSVQCTLSLKLNGEWISKSDVGTECDQGDEGNKRKAAFSDALKRAAVRWGIGRYLYSLPKQWVDFDPQKKQFVQKPSLPFDFLPRNSKQPERNPAPEPKTEVPLPVSSRGAKFREKITDRDHEFFKRGLSKQGELLNYVLGEGKKKGYPDDFVLWETNEMMIFAKDKTDEFEATREKAKAS